MFGVEKISFDGFWARNTEYALKISVSSKQTKYERRVYSFMTLMADFGGFTDGVIFFPRILFFIFAKKMYTNDFYSEMPIKKKAKKNDKNIRLTSKDLMGKSLNVFDIKELEREARLISLNKVSFLRSLLCCCKSRDNRL